MRRQRNLSLNSTYVARSNACREKSREKINYRRKGKVGLARVVVCPRQTTRSAVFGDPIGYDKTARSSPFYLLGQTAFLSFSFSRALSILPPLVLSHHHRCLVNFSLTLLPFLASPFLHPSWKEIGFFDDWTCKSPPRWKLIVCKIFYRV